MCEQKFQEIEEAHLRQMKQLIKGYSHSIEDTHVQVGQVGQTLAGSLKKKKHVRERISIDLRDGVEKTPVLQVHEEFKQNVENIGIENLIQKFAELKGTGKDKPGMVSQQAGGQTPSVNSSSVSAALAGFEDYITALAPEGGKKSRAKAFRIPGLGKRDKEPDST